MTDDRPAAPDLEDIALNAIRYRSEALPDAHPGVLRDDIRWLLRRLDRQAARPTPGPAPAPVQRLLDAVDALEARSIRSGGEFHVWAEERELTAAREALRAAPAYPLSVEVLAAAINDAQIRPDELMLGHDLVPIAERILARLRASSRGASR